MNSLKRLDLLIMQKYELSRTQAARLIREGYAQYKNQKLKPASLFADEEFALVQVTLPPPKKTDVLPEKIKLKIIYEDKDLLIVHKPAGMVVHPACGNYNGTLVNALLYHCKKLSKIGGQERPGLVHRLDKDTAGLMVVALNDRTHRALSRQFERHQVVRKYLALVQGNLPKDAGTIQTNLARSKQNRQRVVVASTGGKTAITHYTVLKRFNSSTLVEAALETGRTHQIRVQFAYIGHPLIGDAIYNKDYNEKKSAQHLIAYRLGFTHPGTKKYVEFQTELPAWAKRSE